MFSFSPQFASGWLIIKVQVGYYLIPRFLVGILRKIKERAYEFFFVNIEMQDENLPADKTLRFVFTSSVDTNFAEYQVEIIVTSPAGVRPCRSSMLDRSQYYQVLSHLKTVKHFI